RARTEEDDDTMTKVKGGRAARPAAQRPEQSAARPSLAQWAWEWVKSIAIAAVIFVVVRAFLVQTYTITSGSMENTALVGDFLIVSKAAYGTRVPLVGLRIPGYEDIDRGEIIVFQGPHQPELDLLKRVVGIPGDTIEMRNRVLYVNGEPVDEPYVRHIMPDADGTHPSMAWQVPYLLNGGAPNPYQPSLNNWGPIVVPPNQYFVLGDNRDDSLDSRYWGFVDRDLIKGRALFVYFSYDRDRGRPFGWLRDVRWSRIGTVMR